MGTNRRSLPHESKKNDYHIDVYTDVEGKEKPEKMHEPVEGPKVDPKSPEALRKRLGSTKGS